MTYDSAIQNYFVTVSGFWLDVSRRWQAARDQAQAGTYGIDGMISDGVALWSRALTSWWNLVPGANIASPLLPTIVLSAAGAGIPGQQLAGSAFLTQPPATGATLAATALRQVGGTGAIGASDVSVAPSTGGIQVTVHVPGGSPAPAAGLYQGLAYDADEEMGLAVILLNVS